MAQAAWLVDLYGQFQLGSELMESLRGAAPAGIGWQSGEDFLHLFSTEGEISNMVQGTTGITNKFLATSRLRRAWVGIKKASEAASKSNVESADLDELIDDKDLSAIKINFFARYRLKEVQTSGEEIQQGGLLDFQTVAKPREEKESGLPGAEATETVRKFRGGQAHSAGLPSCALLVGVDSDQDGIILRISLHMPEAIPTGDRISRCNLNKCRMSRLKELANLAKRCEPLSKSFLSQADGPVQAVTSTFYSGCLAVAVILLSWPDAAFTRRWIQGFQVIGNILSKLSPGEGCKFLREQCMLAKARGFAGPLVKQMWIRPILICSDGQDQESTLTAAFGYLVVDGVQQWGARAHVTEEVRSQWLPAATHSALIEMAAITTGLSLEGTSLARLPLFIFIDNTAALFALVKGGSGNAGLVRMARQMWRHVFNLQCPAYFEYVEAKSNWSDGLSRDDWEWTNRQGFVIRMVEFADMSSPKLPGTVKLASSLVALKKPQDQESAESNEKDCVQKLWIQGFQVVGSVEASHVYPVRKQVPLNMKEFMEGNATHNLEILSKLSPGEGCKFLREQCMLAKARGFAGPLESFEDMNRKWGTGGWRAILRFVVNQSGDKQRACDDGRMAVESDCEDLRDAYQFIPTDPSEQMFNIVSIFDDRPGEMAARFQECECYRRLDCIGLEWGKSQKMAPTGVFWGLAHDLSEVLEKGHVKFWPKGSLITKVMDVTATAMKEDSLTPGEASKLRGTVNFLCRAFFGKIAQGFMNPLIQREYSDRAPFSLSFKLVAAFELLQEVIQSRLERWISVKQMWNRPILICSDGQDQESTLTAAFDYPIVDGVRQWGARAHVTEEVRSKWLPAATHIALIEMAAISTCLYLEGPRMAGRPLYIFIDNTAALFALVKGGSGNADLDKMAKQVWRHLLNLQCPACFEYVETKSNWSEGLSRDDWEWTNKQRFVIRMVECANLSLPKLTGTIEAGAYQQSGGARIMLELQVGRLRGFEDLEFFLNQLSGMTAVALLRAMIEKRKGGQWQASLDLLLKMVNDMFDFDDLPEACQEDAAREGSDLVAKPSRRSSRGAFSALVSSGSNASNDRSSNALRQRCEDHGIASEVIGAVAAADVLREVERLQLLREDELAAECQAQGLGCAPGSLPREELEWRLKQLRIWK
ncbi:unnamed protein product, partial [Polarella glacialis]